ncbi:VOC family protein [Sphingopyxis sp. SE2]|jgi:predicted enzyme related to lactoylglutathione lyase|uniref:VOC family protein n=1 Tax=unclassified Sphingopyxis TaxID=2614943 RepID=UPI00050F15C6|nr:MULTISPECIES: VOC family protein [unclassified Sphingopyxis]KGB55239.1 putative enzyme related to lactoylglutathione lyase [Sphingopyxis sp. LC363]MDT7528780.1 VOC family protein [Sphingopyxis sp. SE2]
MGLLINIDVPDLAAAEHFYTAALGLSASRRFDDDIVELTGCEIPIYLIRKPAGTAIGPGGGDFRRYNRHWTPVHPDFSVENLDEAIAKALAAGAVQEGETLDLPYGRQAMFADPFGNGFCLIAFNERGYDALLT